MIWVTTIVLLFGCVTHFSQATKLGDKCFSNSVCAVRNSYCSILSPSCGSGTCQCIPGFIHVDGTCKRKVLLGFACHPVDDACADENAECINQRCICSQGYTQGLKGYDCIPNMKTKRYRERCFDPDSCYYNLVCHDDNFCKCYRGWKRYGDYDCVKRDVGDTCDSDEDCIQAPNTICQAVSEGLRRCTCIAGFKRVHFFTDYHKTQVSCVPDQSYPRTEGELCNTTAEVPTVCKRPLVCSPCSTTQHICSRVHGQMSNGLRFEVSITLLLALVFVAIRL